MALDSHKLRLDKWLWAARFYKTRSLAAQAAASGKVRCLGQRVKASHAVKLNDCIEIRRGHDCVEVVVTELTASRGSATCAERLYQETAASIEQRAAQAQARKLAMMQRPRSTAKPDKKQRRKIRQFNEKL